MCICYILFPKDFYNIMFQKLKDVGLRAHFTDVDVKRVWHARQTFDFVKFLDIMIFNLWPAAGADFLGVFENWKISIDTAF